MPGSAPFTMTCGGLAGKPKKLRKSATSCTLMLVRPAIAMVLPVPVTPDW
jgi:hypothetical protein